MKHIPDKILNLYIIDAGQIPKEELLKIEHHLSICAECKDYLNDLNSFYKEYSEIKPVDIPVQDFFKILEEKRKIIQSVKINVFELFPLSNENNNQFSRLAALQKEKVSIAYKHVFTYASAERFVILRALYNEALKKYRLYLLSDDMNLVSNAIITLNKNKETFIADKNGIIEIENDIIDFQSNIILYLPVAKYKIQNNLITEDVRSFQNELEKNFELEICKVSGNIIGKLINGSNKAEYKSVIKYEISDKVVVTNITESQFSFPELPGSDIEILIVENI